MGGLLRDVWGFTSGTDPHPATLPQGTFSCSAEKSRVLAKEAPVA